MAQEPPENAPAALMRADAQQRADWAREWLHSEDPSRVAWGAWLARQDYQKALAPLLIEKIAQYQPAETDAGCLPQPERDRHDALLAVLDAVIELDATVPVDDARKLYPEFAAQSLILLVRSRENTDSALLDIARNAKANWNWLAAGNVLVKKPTQGFAALLLSRFTQHVAVSVISPRYLTGGSAGGISSECGYSARPPKPGWPAVGMYWLTSDPERIPSLTATFLVGGNTPVYYWRKVSGNYGNRPDLAGACHEGNRDQYRAEYLNKLQFPFQAMTLDSHPHIIIEWKGRASYRQELIAAVKERREAFRRVVASLQGSGNVLTQAEAEALKPRLEIVIRDERDDRSVALPSILENDETITVRTAFTQPLY
jgi:hypothetical protein